uniref:Transcriptional regulator, y4mF family n=1 Tax=Pectobacterium carotovorum TaxID=554 RepID=A0A0N9NB28_PECCA|nr:helix-turn-helix transcriptional regulator [Pectobacterium carotovorum]ALG88446.1 transcriptional regulator, y4mF family [Pectobacterium carotovorum]
MTPTNNLNALPLSLVKFNRRVGAFIRQRRVAQNLTGTELGRIMHLSQQQISRYERGANSITLYQLNQFILTLGVTWEDFLHDVIDPLTSVDEQVKQQVFPVLTGTSWC